MAGIITTKSDYKTNDKNDYANKWSALNTGKTPLHTERRHSNVIKGGTVSAKGNTVIL